MEEEKYSMHYGAKPIIFGFAKDLRTQQTAYEQLIWEKLKDNQILKLKFRRQHPLSNFIIDFYNHKLKLIIEIDGSIHDTEAQKILDIEKDKYLISENFNILRIKNEEIIDDISSVISTIEQKCKELLSSF